MCNIPTARVLFSHASSPPAIYAPRHVGRRRPSRRSVSWRVKRPTLIPLRKVTWQHQPVWSVIKTTWPHANWRPPAGGISGTSFLAGLHGSWSEVGGWRPSRTAATTEAAVARPAPTSSNSNQQSSQWAHVWCQQHRCQLEHLSPQVEIQVHLLNGEAPQTCDAARPRADPSSWIRHDGLSELVLTFTCWLSPHSHSKSKPHHNAKKTARLQRGMHRPKCRWHRHKHRSRAFSWTAHVFDDDRRKLRTVGTDGASFVRQPLRDELGWAGHVVRRYFRRETLTHRALRTAQGHVHTSLVWVIVCECLRLSELRYRPICLRSAVSGFAVLRVFVGKGEPALLAHCCMPRTRPQSSRMQWDSQSHLSDEALQKNRPRTSRGRRHQYRGVLSLFCLCNSFRGSCSSLVKIAFLVLRRIFWPAESLSTTSVARSRCNSSSAPLAGVSLTDSVPNTGYEPKLANSFSYTDPEHTPIDIPDNHQAFLCRDDATTIPTSPEGLPNSEAVSISQKAADSKVSSLFGHPSLRKLAAGHVPSRSGLQGTGTELDRESVATTLYSLQSRGKKNRDTNVVHSLKDREPPKDPWTESWLGCPKWERGSSAKIVLSWGWGWGEKLGKATPGFSFPKDQSRICISAISIKSSKTMGRSGSERDKISLYGELELRNTPFQENHARDCQNFAELSG